MRVFTIFLSAYLLFGAVFLPGGDFGFISQIGKLYDNFILVNGQSSFDDFLSEEFLDPYSIPDNDNTSSDEPFEQEQHAVPVALINANSISSPFIIENTNNIECYQTAIRPLQTYSDSFTNRFPDSIFHPPRVQSNMTA